MRRLAFATVVAVGCVVAAAADGRPVAYGVAPTKACLAKKGATFQRYARPLPGLTAGEQSEALIGTLPAGGAPVFFYLVVGRDASQARAIIKKLRPSMAQAPSTSNSTSAARGNAAWTLVSIVGALPPAATRTTVAGCLAAGSAPSGVPPSPVRYGRATVGLCLAGTGDTADVVGTAEEALVSKFLFGRALPATLRPHTLIAITHTHQGRKDGLTLLLVFGSSSSDARRLRDDARSALHVQASSWVWSGSKKNVAWYGFRERAATAGTIAWSKRLVAGCLP